MTQDRGKVYFKRAQESAALGKYDDAFYLYLKAFGIHPQMARRNCRAEEQFTEVFKQFANSLEQHNNNEAVFKIYELANRAFPDNVDILTHMGMFLFRNRFYLEAWNYFQTSLDKDPGAACAELQLNALKSHLLPRWHFRMLNDKIRNFSYRDAIRQTVAPGRDTVLDLGSGTGLLALYASECSPLSNIGIEESKILCDIATHVLRDNNSDSVSIINSSSLNMSHVDIGGKKSLLVTELFDAGLFGEGILPSLDHAFKNLLLENCRIIPSRAEFFVRAVKSESLMARYHLNLHAKTLLNIPWNEHLITAQDAYDCGDIDLYKDLTYMTDAESLINVDFNNPADVLDKLSNNKQYSVQLKPLENGEISTIIGWFNLYLTENITLTTDPTSENKADAWQQAIFCNFLPKRVEENNSFLVSFQLVNGSKMSLLPNAELSGKISEATMRFLNDEKYVDLIVSTVERVIGHLQRITAVNEITVADLSPFPIFGLMMLKAGARLVHCQAKTKDDQDFFEKVFHANGFYKEHYRISAGQNDLQNNKFHVIFFNMFNDFSHIDSTQVHLSHVLKARNLIDGGLFMPFQISVIGQIIKNPSLGLHNRLYDENVGYKVAQHINKFQISVNFCIDLTHFEYTALSEPIKLGVAGRMESEVHQCNLIRDGFANATLCWYNIEILKGFKLLPTRRPSCFIDSAAYLVEPEPRLRPGVIPEIICCVDEDQSCKFIIDVDD